MKLNHRTLLAPLIEGVAALGARDRLAILLAGLALAGAADWFLVWPMHRQRERTVSAARDETQGAIDVAQNAAHARGLLETDLDVRARALDTELARLGMGRASGQALGELMARALKPQAVQVVALRELGVEDLQPAQPAPALGAEMAAPATPATPAAEAAEAAHNAHIPAPTPPTLYRHRFELRLTGAVPALLAAAEALEREVRPLRTERVRMASSDGATIELTLTLVVLGTERIWLAL